MNPPALRSLGLNDIKIALIKTYISPGKRACLLTTESTAIEKSEDGRENQMPSLQMGILLYPVAFPEECSNLPFRKKIRLDRCGKTQPSGWDKIRRDAAGGKIPAELTQKRGRIIKASRSIPELFKKSFNACLIRCHGFRSGFYDKPCVFL